MARSRYYTGTGDKGATGLWGGRRVAKTHPVIVALSRIYTLNASLGEVRAFLTLINFDGPRAVAEPLHIASEHKEQPQKREMALDDILESLQHMLFRIGADIATPADKRPKEERIGEVHLRQMEQLIEAIGGQLPPPTSFFLPGGNLAGARLHHAEAEAREAEIAVVAANRTKTDRINPWLLAYMNRLSSLLFLLARWCNRATNEPEKPPEYQ